ncbi:MAG: hypothetical protein KatS3mg014_2532 [Actinomycetota bacterium]|nr:MAG: hypothetical protein KatS3mg014_2473 [Actinomycetota bacterium]GIV00917.1 MAG: hypothetical protein KatS3mg014_2532 [Actinomycetota bacterium]
MRRPFAPPAIERRPNGLFSICEVVTDADLHVLGGVEWQSVSDFTSREFTADLLCSATDMSTRAGFSTAASDGRAMRLNVKCSAMGHDPDELAAWFDGIFDALVQDAIVWAEFGPLAPQIGDSVLCPEEAVAFLDGAGDLPWGPVLLHPTVAGAVLSDPPRTPSGRPVAFGPVRVSDGTSADARPRTVGGTAFSGTPRLFLGPRRVEVAVDRPVDDITVDIQQPYLLQRELAASVVIDPLRGLPVRINVPASSGVVINPSLSDANFGAYLAGFSVRNPSTTAPARIVFRNGTTPTSPVVADVTLAPNESRDEDYHRPRPLGGGLYVENLSDVTGTIWVA